MLFIICWSGTIAVFSYELDWLLNPVIRGHTSTEDVDWQKAYEVFEENFPDSQLYVIHAPLKSGYAIEGVGRKPTSQIFRFYIDPVHYQLNGQTTYLNVQRFFRSFHMALFIQDWRIWNVPFGFWVVTFFGFVLLVSLLTGFVFYKKWRKGFFTLKVNKGIKRLWSDAHKLIGLWSIWFALIISFTGIWYLMEFFLEHPTYKEIDLAPTEDDTRYLSVSELVKRAKTSFPELEIQYVEFNDFKKGIIGFAGSDGSLLVRRRATYVKLKADTGAVYKIQKPAQLSAYARWWETVDDLHFGKFAGIGSKSIWFLFGLGLCALCLTGAYLQAKRQRLRTGSNAYRYSVWTSYILTMGILASATIAGIHEIKGYGADGSWPEVPLPVITFISFWLVSTMIVLTIWIKAVR